ncbi:MAG: ABC transporter ATP-binding protein [Deltaproteobacteria bacterium]|nr:ABC transporter ATP-binding protein [Deltaproteobacteria bacterium]
MIAVKEVSKTYRLKTGAVSALSGVSLSIRNGEFAVLAGSSGSGKSTLLNIIGGLDRDFTGSVSVGGEDLKKMDDAEMSRFRNRKIGFVFQSFNLLSHLTVGENVMLPSLFSGEDAKERDIGAVRAALGKVGLEHKIEIHPNHLSAGEKQRVCIARALFNSPELLLCDEPTGNLDSKNSDSIISLFRELNAKYGFTFLIATHQLSLIESAGAVYRIEAGRMV